MIDREFLAARLVADAHRRLAQPRLGLSHPRIDGNPRSTI
jgi:hypothetical protein